MKKHNTGLCRSKCLKCYTNQEEGANFPNWTGSGVVVLAWGLERWNKLGCVVMIGGVGKQKTFSRWILKHENRDCHGHIGIFNGFYKHLRFPNILKELEYSTRTYFLEKDQINHEFYEIKWNYTHRNVWLSTLFTVINNTLILDNEDRDL